MAHAVAASIDSHVQLRPANVSALNSKPPTSPSDSFTGSQRLQTTSEESTAQLRQITQNGCREGRHVRSRGQTPLLQVMAGKPTPPILGARTHNMKEATQ